MPVDDESAMLQAISTHKKYFCTLDISQAYLHMPVDDESAMLQAISTHKGTYKTSKELHVFFMTSWIKDPLTKSCYTTWKVFKRLRENNLHLNKEKCQFFVNSITYLGHKIDKDGLHPLPDKVEAIVNCSRPKNVEECQ
ncbi:hypothetical protein QE152_g30939 [Popillia japonica]|uniref:Reverse transcriptase domain-containing protein n=1 Tax=Popillia japonica TaxID=7064 RepID=A0AAW1JCU6_POPJA